MESVSQPQPDFTLALAASDLDQTARRLSLLIARNLGAMDEVMVRAIIAHGDYLHEQANTLREQYRAQATCRECGEWTPCGCQIDRLAIASAKLAEQSRRLEQERMTTESCSCCGSPGAYDEGLCEDCGMAAAAPTSTPQENGREWWRE